MSFNVIDGLTGLILMVLCLKSGLDGIFDKLAFAWGVLALLKSISLLPAFISDFTLN